LSHALTSILILMGLTIQPAPLYVPPPPMPVDMGPRRPVPPAKRPAAKPLFDIIFRTEVGEASIWTLEGYEQHQGWSPTKWGHRYDESGYLAAHPYAGRGQRLLVTCLATGLSKHVVVCDRGPARWTGRVIDLSPAVGNAINLRGSGKQRKGGVKVEWLR
jgi:rare lipoprotein A (peptidoglycan hydrolase)